MTKKEMERISEMSVQELAEIISREKKSQIDVIWGSDELVKAFRRLIDIVDTECDDQELISEMREISKKICII